MHLVLATKSAMILQVRLTFVPRESCEQLSCVRRSIISIIICPERSAIDLLLYDVHFLMCSTDSSVVRRQVTFDDVDDDDSNEYETKTFRTITLSALLRSFCLVLPLIGSQRQHHDREELRERMFSTLVNGTSWTFSLILNECSRLGQFFRLFLFEVFFAFFGSVVIRDRKLLIVAIEDKNQLVVGNKVPHTPDVFPRVRVTLKNLRRLAVLSMNLCHDIEPTTLYKIPSNSFALRREERRESEIFAK